MIKAKVTQPKEASVTLTMDLETAKVLRAIIMNVSIGKSIEIAVGDRSKAEEVISEITEELMEIA